MMSLRWNFKVWCWGFQIFLFFGFCCLGGRVFGQLINVSEFLHWIIVPIAWWWRLGETFTPQVKIFEGSVVSWQSAAQIFCCANSMRCNYLKCELLHTIWVSSKWKSPGNWDFCLATPRFFDRFWSNQQCRLLIWKIIFPGLCSLIMYFMRLTPKAHEIVSLKKC